MLTEEQRLRIERNREEALERKRARELSTPSMEQPALSDELKEKEPEQAAENVEEKEQQAPAPVVAAVAALKPKAAVAAPPLSFRNTEKVLPEDKKGAGAPFLEKGTATTAVARRLDALIKSVNGSAEEALECHERLVEAMQEDGGAEDFKVAMAARIERVIVSCPVLAKSPEFHAHENVVFGFDFAFRCFLIPSRAYSRHHSIDLIDRSIGVMATGGARRQSALVRSFCAPTGLDHSCAGIVFP